MTTGTVGGEVREYLERVRARLADVPADEREHLLSDVEAALLDGAGEAELGPPERFADELRAAAGIPLPEPVKTGPESLAWTARTADRLERFTHDPNLRRVGRELAPIWWLARGYLGLVALVVLGEASWSGGYDYVPIFRDAQTTIFTLIVFTGISVAIGMRRRPATAASIVINLAFALLIPVAFVLGAGAGPSYEPTYVTPVAGIAYDGNAVSNVYAYDRRGHLLQDVRLFDQDGHALSVGDPSDPGRELTKTVTGRTVLNAFPIRTAGAQPETGAQLHPRRLR